MNPLNIVKFLVKEFSEYTETKVTSQEEDLALSLKEVILQATEHGSTYIEKVHDLVMEGYGVDIEHIEAIDDPEDECSLMESPDSDYGFNIVSDKQKEDAVFFWRKMNLNTNEDSDKENEVFPVHRGHVVNGRKLKGRKNRKFSSVHTKYRYVTQESALYRWEKQIKAGGSYQSKLKQINIYVLEQFLNAKAKHLQVHDMDLRRWALQKARTENCIRFRASKAWNDKFKKKHRIVSRKITKFVSKKDLKDLEETKERALDFVLETQPMVPEYGAQNVKNSDHCGFSFEMHAGRSNEFQGIKKVEIVCQRKHAMTHSYTILPTMSASGKLVEPLYVILQEKEGKFGPLVRESMFKPENIVAAASKSGKMGKEHLNQWINEVLLPSSEDTTVLLLDAWSAFSDENIQKCVPQNKKLILRHIPQGATSMVQPWDVYGFRIYKNITKHVSDYVILHDLNIELAQRDNVLKLQSLVYNQLCSPRYEALFMYSWYKSGYILNRPDKFPHPNQFCFGLHDSDSCDFCDEMKFITCSWCKKQLCFSCFFVKYHLCHNFVE